MTVVSKRLEDESDAFFVRPTGTGRFPLKVNKE
jgi:hypothetical protein